jgi:VanZ family protein
MIDYPDREVVRLERSVLKRILRLTAWLLLLAIAVLSLVPPWYRPVTGIPHAFEHFAIFFAAGLAFGLGYSTPFLLQLILLILFTAAVEIGQLLVPGRHARLTDFLVDALAVGAGLGLAQFRWNCPLRRQGRRNPI